MKLILFALAFCAISHNAQNNSFVIPEGYEHVYGYYEQVNDDGYDFIGEYSFCTLKTCSTAWYKVYQKDKNYYVFDNRQYYRLMPCNENSYNYYYSRQGIKWYVKL